MILLPLGMQRKYRVEGWQDDLGGHAKLLMQLLPQPFEQSCIDRSDRQYLQMLHKGSGSFEQLASST